MDEKASRLAREHTNSSRVSSARGNMSRPDLEQNETYARNPESYVLNVDDARHLERYASLSSSKQTRSKGLLEWGVRLLLGAFL